MNIHIVQLPVLQSLASHIRMCAPRKAKWLTNDIKINRFWVERAGSGCTRGRRHLWFEAWWSKPPSHKRVGLRRVSVSQICWPRHHRVTALTHLESAGRYLTMGLSTDLNIFQKQYRNKIQTELFYNYDGFFCFQSIKARIMLAVLNWNKSLKYARFAKFCLELC
jgi:hypothetical protein